MYIIKTTPKLDRWFGRVKDHITRQRLNVRLRKAMIGSLGDVKALGSEVFEMREHFGPGWRMYYLQRGSVLIVMLGGGDKASQPEDSAKAMKLAALVEE